MEQEPQIAPVSRETREPRASSAELSGKPELNVELTHDQSESHETSRAESASGAKVFVPPLQLPVPIIGDSVTKVPPAKSAKIDSPSEAADQTLIEDAWVRMAKDIVAKTMGDPRTREDRVSALRADYREKRFGMNTKINSNK